MYIAFVILYTKYTAEVIMNSPPGAKVWAAMRTPVGGGR
jgi:hypothetical protein